MEAEALERAKARSVIGELDQPFLVALKQELFEQWHDELLKQAREELTPEYEAKFQQRCEHLQDEHAGYKRMLQDEADAQREEDRERDRRDIRRKFAEHLETAQEAQAAAEQRLKEADEQLVALMKALLPEGKRIFLYEYGLESLDVWALNHILHRHQLEIVHELTASTRVVKVKTGETAWATASRFTLVAYQAPDKTRSDAPLPRVSYDPGAR